MIQQRPNETDWLAWRRVGIGGSDAAAIAGLSPFKSAIGVWLEKVRGVQLEPSEAMKWGNLLENVIADEFEARTGLAVANRQLCVEHPDWPVARCTLDGEVFESRQDAFEDGEPLGIYEGKTTNSYEARTWEEEVPLHYQLQVQHQLAVTGRERAWVACLVGGQQLLIHELERDEAAIQTLLDMERRFWAWVEAGTMPPADGSALTADALRQAYPSPTVAERELDESVLELLEDRSLAMAEEAAASARREQAENAIKIMLGEAEVGTVAGVPRITWKVSKQTRLDIDALKRAHPDIYRQFAAVSTSRRFSVKEAR